MPGDEEPEQPELDLTRARQAALAAITAYRSPDDPQVLLSVLNDLAEEVPPHWLVTGLLSVANQLLDYLARSQQLDGGEVLRAIAAIEAEASERLARDDPRQGEPEEEDGPGREVDDDPGTTGTGEEPGPP